MRFWIVLGLTQVSCEDKLPTLISLQVCEWAGWGGTAKGEGHLYLGHLPPLPLLWVCHWPVNGHALAQQGSFLHFLGTAN